MPRSNEYLLGGHTYHLTHRCHNREFLLRSMRDRDVYRHWLCEGVERFDVSVYGYCITNNHVHVVAYAKDSEAISGMMHLAAGAVAKQYNLRARHLGAVWEHPFHCTLVEGRRHLLNCLAYVDLNMVRAGCVPHPEAWRWCGYDEVTGQRTRYRILDLKGLVRRLGYASQEAYREEYAALLKRKIDGGELSREPGWTESLAVGDQEFIEQAAKLYPHRSRFVCEYLPGEESRDTPAWRVRET